VALRQGGNAAPEGLEFKPQGHLIAANLGFDLGRQRLLAAPAPGNGDVHAKLVEQHKRAHLRVDEGGLHDGRQLDVAHAQPPRQRFG
jgi:hypothetical protein